MVLTDVSVTVTTRFFLTWRSQSPSPLQLGSLGRAELGVLAHLILFAARIFERLCPQRRDRAIVGDEAKRLGNQGL